MGPNSTDTRNSTNITNITNLRSSVTTTRFVNSSKGPVQIAALANCTTRFDERVHSIVHATSPPGTPCVFGLDARDEGGHCIFDDGEYGSLGWCYTDINKKGWGACGEMCPLYGQANILGRQIDQVLKELEEEMDMISEVFVMPAPTNARANTSPTVGRTLEAGVAPLNVSGPISPRG